MRVLRPIRPWRVVAARQDPLLAAAMLVIGEVMVATRSYGSGSPWVVGVGVAALSALLVLRRRRPWAMCLAVVVVWTLVAVLGAVETSIWALLLMLIVSYTAGAQLGGRRSGVALALILAATYTSTWLTPDAPLGDRLFTPPVLAGGPWLAGTLARRFREQAVLLAVLNWELDERRSEDVRLAAQLERSRIARELHDVVSHGLGLILVQAAAARRLLDADPARAVEPLDQIRATGKHALTDMRHMLGLLREPEEAATAESGMEHLDRLVERLAAAGVDVRVVVEGSPVVLSAERDLAAYRVVQEAVTNAVRHGQTRTVRIVLRHDIGTLVATIDNDVMATGSDVAGAHGGTGRGLRGMRERASLVGGRVEAGPMAGGWRVRFEVPVDDGVGA